jgi:hypothetical protein
MIGYLFVGIALGFIAYHSIKEFLENLKK